MSTDAFARIQANGAVNTARAANRFAGYSVISHKPVQTTAARTGTNATNIFGARLEFKFPAYAVSELIIGLENGYYANGSFVASAVLPPSNQINWKASIEPTGIAAANISTAAPNSASPKIKARFKGNDRLRLDPLAYNFSDPVRGYFKASTVGYVNVSCCAISAPIPSAPTVAATAGTTVPAGTYYVGVSIVYGDGMESPVSAGSSVTTASSNLAILVTAPSAASYPGAVAWRSYVSIAGAASTAQLYYTGSGDQQMGVNQTISALPNLTGTGFSNMMRQATPNTVQMGTGAYVGGGTATQSCNNGEAFSTSRDVAEFGWSAAAATTTAALGPFVILAKAADGIVRPSIGVVGHSICRGTGDDFTQSTEGGWLYRLACGQAGNLVYDPTVTPACGQVRVAVPSQTFAQAVSQFGYDANQKAMLATHIYFDLATNDISGGTYASACISYLCQLASTFTSAGRFARTTTVLPRTASSDGGLTVANQTMPYSGGSLLFPGNRTQYNNVLRSSATGNQTITSEAMFRNSSGTVTSSANFFSGGDGSAIYFSTAFPFVQGTEVIRVAGVALTAGTDYTYQGVTTINGVSWVSGVQFTTPPANGASVTASYTGMPGIQTVFADYEAANFGAATNRLAIVDVAALFEANGSGTITLGGQWWAINPASNITTGSSPSATTANTITTGVAMTQDQYRGNSIVITTDPVTPTAVGQASCILGNTAAGVLSFNSMAVTPSTSCTWVIRNNWTNDMTHPSPSGYSRGDSLGWAAQFAADMAMKF